MNRILLALTILFSTTLSAADITIVDASKGYEHFYSVCNINLQSNINPEKYLYATCTQYAAPFKTPYQSDISSVLYDEIGVNGVVWHNCRLVGNGIQPIRFECNVPFINFTKIDVCPWEIGTVPSLFYTVPFKWTILNLTP